MRKSFQTQPALFALAAGSDHPVMKSLDGLGALIDWGAIEVFSARRGESGHGALGRPGYPALMLFRALLLGQICRLSGLQLANQVMRDLVFRRFCRW
jgi:transposase, IS5 family